MNPDSDSSNVNLTLRPWEAVMLFQLLNYTEITLRDEPPFDAVAGDISRRIFREFADDEFLEALTGEAVEIVRECEMHV